VSNVKILQIIPVFSEFFGGPVFDVQSISRHLSKEHEVTIYTTTATDWNTDGQAREEWLDRIHVIYPNRAFKFKPMRELLICKGFNRLLNDNIADFDVIHLHTWRQFMEFSICKYAVKYGIPYVHQSHGALSRTEKKGRKLLYETIFGHKVLRNASSVIALSNVEANEYSAMGVAKNKINVIPNGIDLFEYRCLPSSGTFKKKFGINSEQKIILYLGRIHRTKGIDFLVNTFARLLRNPSFQNTLLVIAGPDEGGYLQEIKQLVFSLGIVKNVLFPGILLGQEKIAAFVDASICAYLRPNEPFGRVSLEAAASGTPVVVCRDSPMANIVQDGNFGFSVDYGDINQLLMILESSLSSGLSSNMGKNGREYVLKNFSWEKITCDLVTLYQQMASLNYSTKRNQAR
jgi:glycosyltransferase involved in cell wall biosynthesis